MGPAVGGKVISVGTAVLIAAVCESSGALLAGGDVVSTVSKGIISPGNDWVGPYNDLTFGFQQAAKYYYYPGWHEPGSMLELLINQDEWNALPKHLQVIIETAAKAVNQDILDEYTARNNVIRN